MDWSRAKKIILLVLVVLNAALFGLNRYYNTDYRITQDEESAINELLEQNGIEMYSKLIYAHEPMKQLDVTVTSPGIDELKKTFFSEDEKIETIIDFDQSILKSYSATLISEDSRLIYECPTGYGESNGVGKTAAQRLSDEFMKNMGESYSEYKLDRITYKNGGYQLEYYEYYKGIKIFCNYCIFFVDDNGIKTIESENYDVNGFVEDNREICSSSEALLTYIYGSDGKDKAEDIEEIEIGYDLKAEEEIVDGSKIRLVPCYYIHALNMDEPFVVYAYNNTAKISGANMSETAVLQE